MLQKLAIWLLLPAMLLNGLWMVCDPSGTTEAPMTAEERADCIRICARLEAEFGRICIIWPGYHASINVIDYGAAILPDEMVLTPAATTEHVTEELSLSHFGPCLSQLTPPPRA
jgi:hypothetical protein